MMEYNSNLKNLHNLLKTEFPDYCFILTDNISIIEVTIFKLFQTQHTLIGDCKIPYKLYFYNDWYSINLLIKKVIDNEKLRMDK